MKVTKMELAQAINNTSDDANCMFSLYVLGNLTMEFQFKGREASVFDDNVINISIGADAGEMSIYLDDAEITYDDFNGTYDVGFGGTMMSFYIN